MPTIEFILIKRLNNSLLFFHACTSIISGLHAYKMIAYYSSVHSIIIVSIWYRKRLNISQSFFHACTLYISEVHA